MRPSIDVVVVGELAIESHLVRFGRAVPGNPPPMRLFREPAGAARLARLLAGVAGELRASNIEVAVRPFDAGAGAAAELREQQHASGAAERISCTFFEWTREGKPPAWRVRSVIGREPGDAPPSVPRLDGADVIVVTADVDPGPLPPAAWVVCTLQSPVASGPFWHRLHDEHPDRVIVIVDADDLRTAEVQISRDLSWERTAQDAFWELVHNPRINGLARCEHVVITFDRDGALWLARREGGWDARLFFNPDGLERTWSAALPGSVPDGRPCIV